MSRLPDRGGANGYHTDGSKAGSPPVNERPEGWGPTVKNPDSTTNGPLGPDIPATVSELQDGCSRFVKQAVGIDLDGTQDTLPLLDHYLRGVPKDAPAEALDLVIPAAGAYFGEVLRRSLGDGVWVAPAADYDNWSLSFRSCSLHFNPVGIVHEVHQQDGTAGVLHMSPADRRHAEARLKETGEVTGDDYYRLAVRFETIEQLYLMLSELPS